MSVQGLRRFTTPVPAVERCELCGAPLGEPHRHVVALDERALRCTCRACHLLFTHDAAGRGRFRAVPERYLTDPAHPLAEADRVGLGIPVGTAFVFVNSDAGAAVAGYPSPAGATECLLDSLAWQALYESYPLLALPAADVEAVYLSGAATFLVPIDACYRLAGRIRLCWRGLDGGPQVSAVLAGFLDELRTRSRALRPGEA